MNIQALPKILFLNQESQQMQDRRIRVKVEYDTTGSNPVKKIIKKINNTIELSEELHQDNQINCIAYSNKYGLLITCVKDQILITDSDHVESYIATQNTSKKSLKKVSFAIDFAGKVYLSPDETKILAVNHDEFLLFDLNTQETIWKGANQHHLRHIVFVTSNSFVGWNFQSTAFLYENINEKLSSPKPFEGIEKCTSVNVIQNHIIVCEKINQKEDDEDTKIIVFDNAASSVLNEIKLRQYGNPDNYFFEYTQIISVFSIKNEKQGQFNENDIYGLVLGYYDDEQYEPDRRYLNFMKGNILQKDADLKIRAFELFLSPTEDRSFFYNQNQEKIPFQVQILTTETIKIIMIEHLEIVFVVDCNEPFEKLKLYTLQPAHEVKLQGNKYFKGICLMRHMLEAERKPPASDSNETCNMICRDFEGEFMSLYFPAKETELTVPFPSSLLILGDDKISRRYAIETYNSVEEYETEKIKEKISVIYKTRKQRESKGLMDNKIQEKKKILLNKPIGEIKPSEPVVERKTEQKPKEEEKKPKQQEKKPSLFGSISNTSNLSNLFGNLKTNTQTESKPAEENKLFSAKPETTGTPLFAAKPAGTSLFKSKPSTGPSIFDKLPKPAPGAPIFGQQKQQTPPETKPSIFGQTKQETLPESKPSIFSQPKQEAETKPSVFGQPKQENSPETQPKTSIISIKLAQEKPQTGLFAQTENKQPQTKKDAPNLSNETKPSGLNFLSGKTSQPKLSQLSLADKKPQQSKPSTLLNQSIPSEKVVVKKPQAQVKTVKKEINLDKFKQLAALFGHGSLQSLPAPLMNLSEQQIDALISLTPKKEPESQKSAQQLARQKLLKEEHFSKIVDNIDETKNYLKTLKQTNQAITSPTIFTLKNAKELAKSQFTNSKKEEIKTKNPLANLVKNYVQRMQFLHKQYLNLEEESENRNPNNIKALQEKQKMKEYKVKEGLEEEQKKIQYLVYYEQKVFPDKSSFFNLNDNTENYDKKLTETVIKKAENVQELTRKVGKLLENYEESKLKESTISSVKSSSILTVASKQSRKKGHFAFSLDSSSSSDEEYAKLPIKNIDDQVSFEVLPHKNKKILIKFTPKSFNMMSQQYQNISPLVKLTEFSTPLLYNQEELNPADLFRVPSNHLQSSMKKSINFKDKIPLKKDQREEEEKIKKIKKFGFSQDLEEKEERNKRCQFISVNSDQEEEDIAPDMSRSLSKFPQNMVAKKGADKTVELSAQDGIKIKKTTQFDVSHSDKLKNETKSSASVFGIAPKVQSKQDKKEPKAETKPSPSLFGNLSTGSLFGAKVPEEKPEKNQQKKDSQSGLDAKKGAIGAFAGKKVQIDSEDETKKEQKPISLFGNIGGQPTGSLFGGKVEFGSKTEVKPASTTNAQKKQETKVTEKKEQPKIEKKEPVGLFGTSTSPASGGLFGQSSVFANPAQKSTQQIKLPEPSLTKPSEPVSKPTQKPTEQPKTATESSQAEKKQEKKSTGLFGTSQNKSPLFGNNNTTLFGNNNKDGLFGKKEEQSKDQKPKEQKTTENKALNDSSIGPSFAGSSGSTIFGSAGGTLFGKSQVKKEDQSKPKELSQLFGKPAEQPKSAETVAPLTKPETKPATTQQSSTSLFGTTNQSAGGNLFGQTASTQNSLAGGFQSQSKPAQTFGATNRFMINQSQLAQPQQAPTFKAMDASFAPGGGFNQPASTTLKSFASFGTGNQSGGLFGQNSNQPQGQGTNLFGQSNPVANPLANTMNQQPNNQALFGVQTSGQNMFGAQQSGGFFGGMSQQQNQGGNPNFLSGFNVSSTIPVNPGTASNSAMFKARK